MKNKAEPVSLSQVTAVMCNYARPKSARLVVKRLRDLGLTEIIVWNNGAKPIPGANQNIHSEENIGAIGKYHGALHASRPYVLMVDDDVLLTRKGLNTLLKYATRYPAVVQAGLIFSSPFKKRYKRKKYLSDKVKTIKRVDVVISNRGMILKTDLCRAILNHWVWGCLKVVRKGFITTDIPVSCAILDLTGRHPVVAPVAGHGYVCLPDEAPEKASRNQKNFYEERTKMLKWLVNKGWKLLGDSKKTDLDLTGRHPVVVPDAGRSYVSLPDEAQEKASRNQKSFNEERTKILKWLVNKGRKLLGDSKKTD